jgi:hypothetical protein
MASASTAVLNAFDFDVYAIDAICQPFLEHLQVIHGSHVCDVFLGCHVLLRPQGRAAEPLLRSGVFGRAEGAEFMRDGFQRIRHYGFLAQRHSAAKLARIRELLPPAPQRRAGPGPVTQHAATATIGPKPSRHPPLRTNGSRPGKAGGDNARVEHRECETPRAVVFT